MAAHLIVMWLNAYAAEYYERYIKINTARLGCKCGIVRCTYRNYSYIVTTLVSENVYNGICIFSGKIIHRIWHP